MFCETMVVKEVNSKFLDKKDLYLSLSTSGNHVDKCGWLNCDKCDGLLYNCLWSIAGADVMVTDARDMWHKWHRHPSFTCYSNNESKSEISRDMLLGLLLWIVFKREESVLSDLIGYGEQHSWLMGAGDLSRTFVTPSLRGTIYLAAHVLSNRNTLARFFPKDWCWPLPFSIVTNQQGYKRHLQALHIYVLSLLRDPTKREIEIMKYHADHEPLNALYRAIYNHVAVRNQEDAIALLMNEKYFPNDRLPSNREYRANYLFSHDQISLNWSNDYYTTRIEHPGVDWLFTAKVIEASSIWIQKKKSFTLD